MLETIRRMMRLNQDQQQAEYEFLTEPTQSNLDAYRMACLALANVADEVVQQTQQLILGN